MVDVLNLPDGAFGYVPTPALVAPLEFTISSAEYVQLGGHMASVREISDVLEEGGEYGASVRALGGDL